MGFVAASPQSPTIAFSLSLLHFLHTLWKESPLGIDAFLKASWAYHRQTGGISRREITQSMSETPNFDPILTSLRRNVDLILLCGQP